MSTEVPQDQLDRLLAEQARTWRAGRPVSIDELARLHPQLSANALLDLIYSEVVLREEAGQSPHAEEYASRFPELAREIRDQFQVHRALEDGKFPSTATGDVGTGSDRSDHAGADDGEPGAGTAFGRYRVLQQIGKGGFGIVYLAEQIEPVRRRVAVKVIKPGMDSRQIVRRFEAERQALALMDHPNVAKVFDAGTTPQRRPYFVMEHVPGDAITDYCDRQRLTTRQRLELFLPVCDAVQHAHQKGIIHRDLKPSNVLVQVVDGRPVPKVIDFGIAKALSQPLTQQTLYTEAGQLMGTPEYMSPEQAEMTGVNVDTRTDIYSLGAILYQLLTGALPFGSETLRDKSYLEIQRIIRDVDPPRPSTRVSQMEPSSAEAARRRSADRRTLRRQISGDLDWITTKAMEKDRTRRYASASELSADIGRHLRNEPVLAGPPSARYRVGKFVRRHRAQVAWAAALLVVLIAGLIGTSAALFQAVRSRDAERAARTLAQERFRQVHDLSNRFLFDFYDSIATVPGTTGAKELLVSTALEYLDRLAKDASDDPQLQRDLAWAYMRVAEVEGGPGPNLGRTADALEHQKRGLELIEQLAAATPHDDAVQLDLAKALNHRGQLLQSAGEFGEALATFERERDLRLKLAGRGAPPGRPTTALAQLDSDVGWLQERTGALEQAAQSYSRAREAFALLVEQDQDGDDSTARYHLARINTRLGTVLSRLGDEAQALRLLNDSRSALKEFLRVDPNQDHVRRMLITTVGHLSQIHKTRGEIDEAIRALREANRTLRDMLKADPRDRTVARALAVNNSRLADVLWVVEDDTHRDEALRLLDESLELTRRLVREDPAQLEFRNDLTITLFMLVDLTTQRATAPQTSTEDRARLLAVAGRYLEEGEAVFADVLQRGLDPGQAVRDSLRDIAADYRAVVEKSPTTATTVPAPTPAPASSNSP